MTNPRTSEVLFDPARHAYHMPERPGLTFRRCSEFVESFFEPFDGPAIAQKLIKNYPKYADRTEEELIAEWEGAAVAGTEVHAQVQRYIQEGAEPTAPRALRAKAWVDEKYPSSDYVREPEVVVHEANLRIAGTTDLLARRMDADTWELLDWKTNKKIETRPFQNKKGIRGPARAWPDCNYFKYSLQLSLYRFLLEHHRGLRFSRQVIVHLTEDGVVPYPCEYLRSQVEAMIDHDISGPAMFAALDAL